MKTKSFRVFSVSSGHNSFGLYGHILVARDGMAFEVGRCKGPWLDEWPKGKDVEIPVDALGEPQWSQVSCEIPNRLDDCPEPAVQDLYGPDAKLPNRAAVNVIDKARKLLRHVRGYGCVGATFTIDLKTWELLEANMPDGFNGGNIFNVPVMADPQAKEPLSITTKFLPA